MFSKLRYRFIGTTDKKRLVENMVSLGFLQGINYILPLLTVPYLVRVLGINYFGLLAFVTAIIAYFSLVADYGFDLSATKQISDNRKDRETYSRIFNEVLSIKVFFVMGGLLVLTLIAVFSDFFGQHVLIYYLTFGTVIGNALFPIWFFQGMESMKSMAMITGVAKACFTVAIFLFVHEQDDYWKVPLLLALGFMVSGVYALCAAVIQYKIKLSFPSYLGIKRQLYDGWHVFLSRLYVNLYTTSNMVLLGLMTNNVVVGYYAIAEKILQACIGIFSPISQALYPYLANIYKSSKEQFFDVFKKINGVFFVVALIFALLSWLMAAEIVLLVSGEANENIVAIFSVLAIAIATGPFGSSFTNAFLILKKSKKVLLVVTYTMLANIILIVPFIYYFQALGLAITVVCCYVFHVGLYLYHYGRMRGLT